MEAALAALDALDKIPLPATVIVEQAVWVSNLKKVEKEGEGVGGCSNMSAAQSMASTLARL
jgi:hypothetical protein